MSTFNDIPDLLACWNTGESTTNTTGTVIDSITPAYVGLPVDQNLTVLKGDTPGVDIHYDSGSPALIDAMPAWDATSGGGSPDNCLTVALTNAIDCSSEGFTVVSVFQVTTASINEMWAITETNNALAPLIDGSAGVWRSRTPTGDSSSDIAKTTLPTIHIYTHAPGTTPVIRAWTDDSPVAIFDYGDPTSPTADLKHMACAGSLRGGVPGQYGARAKQSIFAVYNRALEQSEIDTVYALCRSWITTNAPPVSAVKPTLDPITPSSPVANVDGGFTVTSARSAGDLPMTFQWLAADSLTPNTYVNASVHFGAGNITGDDTSESLVVTNVGSDQAKDGTRIKQTAANAGGTDATDPVTLAVNVGQTSCTFGPALANDASANYTWQCNIGGNAGWALVSATPALLATERWVEGEGSYLDVNAATADQTDTLVRCKASTQYNDGLLTETNTLIVVGA